MSGFSKYLAQAVFNMTLNPSLASWTPPAAVYLAVHTSAPDDATYGGEASYSGYARVLIGNMASTIEAGATATDWTVRGKNVTSVVFPVSDGPTQTVTHWAIWDHPDRGSGNILYSGSVGTPKVVAAGDALTVGNAQLVVDFK